MYFPFNRDVDNDDGYVSETDDLSLTIDPVMFKQLAAEVENLRNAAAGNSSDPTSMFGFDPTAD